jgi:O-antigen ligase
MLTIASVPVAAIFLSFLLAKYRLLSPRYFFPSAILTLLIFGELLSKEIQLFLYLGTAIGSFFAAFHSRKVSPSNINRLNLTVAVIVAYWSILVFHANVPEIGVGLEGLRKTTFAIIGIHIGTQLRAALRFRFELTVIWLLGAALFASAFAFLVIGTSTLGAAGGLADIYTSQFRGTNRLEGIFAGPFHVALAAAILIIWSVVNLKKLPVQSSVLIAIGTTAAALSLVRASLLAILVGVLAIFVLRRQPGTAFSKVVIAGTIGFGLVLLVLENSTIQQIPFFQAFDNLSEDSRLINRLNSWDESWNLVRQSPIVGWGAGSSGDALGSFFSGTQAYVTSHNLVLKLLVEGGIFGLILWLSLAIQIIRLAKRSVRKTEIFAMSFMFTMYSLSGSTIEALPVSLMFFVLIGIWITEETTVPGISWQLDRAKPKFLVQKTNGTEQGQKNNPSDSDNRRLDRK